jgi:hypothetical protein
MVGGACSEIHFRVLKFITEISGKIRTQLHSPHAALMPCITDAMHAAQSLFSVALTSHSVPLDACDSAESLSHRKILLVNVLFQVYALCHRYRLHAAWTLRFRYGFVQQASSQFDLGPDARQHAALIAIQIVQHFKPLLLRAVGKHGGILRDFRIDVLQRVTVGIA